MGESHTKERLGQRMDERLRRRGEYCTMRSKEGKKKNKTEKPTVGELRKNWNKSRQIIKRMRSTIHSKQTKSTRGISVLRTRNDKIKRCFVWKPTKQLE